MSAKQTKINRFRRFLGWLARHKITTGFILLVLFGVFYLVISVIVLQVQIHFERERFVSANNLVARLDEAVHTGNSTNHFYRNCTYTDNGAVFATKFLGCQIVADLNFQDFPRQSSPILDSKVLNILRAEGIKYVDNKSSIGAYDVSNYTFMYKNLTCGYSTTYYPAGTAKESRYNEALPTGNNLLVTLGCSGPAKAEYFPVSS